jgi:hypothetical protein
MKKKATARPAKTTSRQSTLNFPTSSEADLVAESAAAETSTKTGAKNRRKRTADFADDADKHNNPHCDSYPRNPRLQQRADAKERVSTLDVRRGRTYLCRTWFIPLIKGGVHGAKIMQQAAIPNGLLSRPLPFRTFNSLIRKTRYFRPRWNHGSTSSCVQAICSSRELALETALGSHVLCEVLDHA